MKKKMEEEEEMEKEISCDSSSLSSLSALSEEELIESSEEESFNEAEQEEEKFSEVNVSNEKEVKFERPRWEGKINTQLFSEYEKKKITPISIFTKIISEEITNYIAEQSNIYYNQNVFIPNSKTISFQHLDSDSVYSFIGILLIMGINKLPGYRDHWSSKKYIKSPVPQLISQNKFRAVWRFLHFEDNSLIKSKDAVMKVQPLLSRVAQNWRLLYTPGSELTIDESMIGYQGRTIFKQYEPRKPTKWGIKCWSLAEASSGYLLDMIIYTGKREESVKNMTKGEQVVLRLGEKYFHRQHTFVFDSFYSNVSLLQRLSEHKCFAIGMTNQNRKGLPRNTNLQKSKFYFFIFIINSQII